MNSNARTVGQNMEDASEADANGFDFVGLFCQKFDCTQAKYEKRLFWECLYPQGTAFARLLRVFNPGFFKSDLDLIERLKHTTSFSEVKQAVDFHGAHHASNGALRLIFKVRLSKQRILQVARTLFTPPV